MTTTGAKLRTVPAVRFSPTQLPGLAGWYAADKITGLADAAAVATWIDSSGNSRDATQGTAGNRPSYETNERNGLPIVRFDGTNDRLDCNSLAVVFSGTDVAKSVFAVAKQNSGDGLIIGFGLSSAIADARSTFFYRYINASTYLIQRIDNTTAGVNFGGIAPDTNWHVTSAVIPGTTGGFRVDGATAAADGSAFDVGLTSFDQGCIGALHFSTSFGNFFNGDIGEVVVYNRAVSTAERTQLERYLGAKWAVTVA